MNEPNCVLWSFVGFWGEESREEKGGIRRYDVYLCVALAVESIWALRGVFGGDKVCFF